MVRPIFDYGDALHDSCLKSESVSVENFQRKAALICTGAFSITSHERLLKGTVVQERCID